MPYYIKRTKAKKKDKPLPLFDKAGVTIKKKPDLKAKLDKVFSLYIRLRDSKPFGYKFFKCISCGEIKPFEKGDCGHFWSRKNMSLRYSELNCSCECSFCNRFKADHLIGYEKNLIAKIGKQKFDMLVIQVHQTKKYSDFELQELIKYYQALNKKMLAEK